MSALTIAAGATMAIQMASGADLTLFYDNAAIVGNDYTFPGPAIGAETFPNGPAGGGGTIDQSLAITQGAVNTINLSVGQVLEFGIDAVVTNNINPDGGKITGGSATTGFLQPTNLGLAVFGMIVPSNDSLGATLLPLTDGSGPVGTFPDGHPYFNSTAQINNGTTSGAGIGQGGGATDVPHWLISPPGDTSPTEPLKGGQVGVGFQISGGNIELSGSGDNGNSKGAISALQYFAGTSATTTQSTDFFDSLAYQALRPGSVTLSPAADIAATTYWSLSTPGGSTAATPSVYRPSFFTKSDDVLTPLPSLVINIIGEPRAIFSVSPTIDGPRHFPAID